jgi:hypothetical protein
MLAWLDKSVIRLTLAMSSMKARTPEKLRCVWLQIVSVQQQLHEHLKQVGMWDHKVGITITGYSALFCFSALCTTLLLISRRVYIQWRGVDDSGYTQVLKSGDV